MGPKTITQHRTPRSHCLTIRGKCRRYSIAPNMWLPACAKGTFCSTPVAGILGRLPLKSGLAGAPHAGSMFWLMDPARRPPPPLFPPQNGLHPSKDSPGPTQAKHTNILHYASHLQTCITMQGRVPGMSEQERWRQGHAKKGIRHAELSHSIRIRVRFALSASMLGAPAEGPELGELTETRPWAWTRPGPQVRAPS